MRLLLHVYTFYGRAVVGEPRGSPDCWNAGLLTPPRARSPFLKKARVGAIQSSVREIAP